jgi:hypothetical protein
LQAYGIEHPGRSFTKAGRRGAFDGFEGKAFDDDAAEAIQIDKMGKLDAVTERATGGKNGIAQAQGANLYAEIDSVRGTHFGKSLS